MGVSKTWEPTPCKIGMRIGKMERKTIGDWMECCSPKNLQTDQLIHSNSAPMFRPSPRSANAKLAANRKKCAGPTTKQNDHDSPMRTEQEHLQSTSPWELIFSKCLVTTLKHTLTILKFSPWIMNGISATKKSVKTFSRWLPTGRPRDARSP